MTSGFLQYIAGYTVANLWRYPITRRVAFASALEYLMKLFLPILTINEMILKLIADVTRFTLYRCKSLDIS